MVNLVSIINKTGTEANFDTLILPARQYLESAEMTLGLTVREQTQLREEALPEVNRSSKTLRREMREATRLRTSLKNELKDALPVEKAGLQKDIAEVTQKISTLEKQLAKAQKPITDSEASVQRLTVQNSLEDEYLKKVVAVYPSAQVIDLQCLALLRGKDGLPALTLYSPNYSHSMIFCYFGTERMAPSLSMVYNVSQRQRPAVQSKIITASLPDDEERAVETPFVSQRYAVAEVNRAVAKGISKIVQHATGVTLGTQACRIVLQAQFSEKFKVIPKDARQLIREASKDPLFDKVLLLAEVPRWNVSYLESRAGRLPTPKIKGTIEQTPRSDDPLILGVKQIGDKRVATIIGAFDTTPVEHYARSEFGRRIQEPDSKTK